MKRKRTKKTIVLEIGESITKPSFKEEASQSGSPKKSPKIG